MNQCNAVIESLENNDIPGLDEDLKTRFLAESLFIRAHYFYHLVQQFGDIPMPLKPTNSVETTAHKTKVDEVWNQIVTDLEFAVENFRFYDLRRWGKLDEALHLSLIHI